MHAFSIDPRSPTYPGFGGYQHNRKLFDPDFKDVVTPNNDTLYSTAFADLRAEPLVITVPPTGDRYFVIQLVDLATDNFAYVGTRETGRNGGNFVLVGPTHKGALPAGRFDRVITTPSQFVALATRTAVSDPRDAAGAAAIQDAPKLTPLSRFLGSPAPAAAAADFLPYDGGKAEGIEFFAYLDRLWTGTRRGWTKGAFSGSWRASACWATGSMRSSPTASAPRSGGAARRHRRRPQGDRAARQRPRQAHRRLGVHPADGQFRHRLPLPLGGGGKFLYTNSPEEALPPARAFWSITLYDAGSRRLVHNDLGRYSIGDRTAGLKRDADGGLTIHIQRSSPGKDRESNWLPTPDGPFYLVLRAYLPSEDMIAGRYLVPPGCEAAPGRQIHWKVLNRPVVKGSRADFRRCVKLLPSTRDPANSRDARLAALSGPRKP